MITWHELFGISEQLNMSGFPTCWATGAMICPFICSRAIWIKHISSAYYVTNRAIIYSNNTRKKRRWSIRWGSCCICRWRLQRSDRRGLGRTNTVRATKRQIGQIIKIARRVDCAPCFHPIKLEMRIVELMRFLLDILSRVIGLTIGGFIAYAVITKWKRCETWQQKQDWEQIDVTNNNR